MYVRLKVNFVFGLTINARSLTFLCSYRSLQFQEVLFLIFVDEQSARMAVVSSSNSKQGLLQDNGKTRETTEEKVKKVLVEKLNLDPVPEIERAHRTGRPTRHGGTPKPRTVVSNFTSYKAKESILKAARRMKQEGIQIFEDLAEETMEKRRAQLPQVRKAKAQGKIAYFSLDRLIIKDRTNGSGSRASYPSISGEIFH